jgi:hypothetical protein
MPNDSEKLHKTIKFRGFKAEWVLNGQKSSTIRLFDDKDLQTGDDVDLINADTGGVFAHATVTEVIAKKLSEITESDLIGHEKYESTDAMYASFRKFYGDRVTPDTIAKIVRFKIKS